MPLKISMQFWNWGQKGIDFNPHFFTYPAFTFYFNYAIEWIQYLFGYLTGAFSGLEVFHKAYDADPTSFVMWSRTVMLLFDLGSLLVTYKLGSLFCDRRIGLLAAFLVAINPLHIQRVHLINVDTPLTFFCILSVLFIYKLYSDPEMKWYILAGVSIGLAAATKYNGSILILVLLAAHLLRSRSLRGVIQSFKTAHLFLAIGIAGSIFVIFNPYIILNFNSFRTDILQVQLHMELGHLGLDPGRSTVAYYLLESLPQNLGWPLLVSSLGSAIYLVLERKRANWVLLSFPILYFALISPMAMRDDRYIFPMFPPLILIGSIGLFKFWDGTQKYLNERKWGMFAGSPGSRFTFGIVCGLIILIPPFSQTWKYQKDAGLTNTRAVVKAWIIKNIPLGSVVASGPFAVELPKGRFLNLPIPFNAGNTEQTVPFYDPAWYEDIDLVITSDYDYGRYEQEPERFHDILRFYDTLRTRWTLVYETKPNDTTSGPTFWLYKPPASSREIFDPRSIKNMEEVGDSQEVLNFIGKLGLALKLKGKLLKSEQLLREVLSIDTNNIVACKDLAPIEYNLGKFPEALSVARKYLHVVPEDAEMITLEGSALLQLGELDEAQSRLERALDINPHLDPPYLDLSVIYSLRNDRQKTIDILSRYLNNLPPSSRRAKLVEQQLEGLKRGG